MKNSTFPASFALLLLLFSLTTSAQKTGGSQNPSQLSRCGTWGALETNLQRDPMFRAQYEKGLRDYEMSLSALNRGGATSRTSTLPDSVVIPVVVHIVLPNPFVVTDADVQFFIDRLNRDYSGRNADSTNGTLFYSVRGRSKLRFTLARRTPANTLTNGIERKVGSIPIALTTYQAIKHATSGGLDPWDVNSYYNLWVGDGSSTGLLGIAPNIGPGLQTETTTSNVGIDGICVDYHAFAGNTCYTYAAFNLGRTAVHEIGHNFGLFHINGDAACGNDFQQIFGSCQLPAALLAPSDDTPTQSALTSGCPTGAAASGCAAAPNPPGKMYQNYMDYTNDACYSMFTKGQVARMEYVLEFCRPGYLTTQGAIPPTGAITLDAAPSASVNPGGFELVGCNTVNYPSTLSCPGSVAPKFRVVNNGLNTITSLTVGYRYDNGTAVTQNITVNIPSGATYVHTFSSGVAAGVGAHTFKFFTSSPNGGTDQVPANDTLTQAFSVSAPVGAPLSEGFESTTFPPANWTLNNPGGDFTWQRTTPGRNASLGKASINNYDVDATGNIDEIRSPAITVTPGTPYAITFDIAHKYYPAPINYDVFSILVSGDCGQTFTQVYSASGPTLATAGSSTAAYTTPAAADWATRIVNIPASVIAAGQIQVIFRNTTNYGNWIHLDNINIGPVTGRDLRLASINSPLASVCSSTVTPSVTISNDGSETITSFKVGYRIDNGANTITTFTQTLAPGAQATLTLPAGAVTPGARTITAFTADPVSSAGTGDTKLTNDTATKAFTVNSLLVPPVVEGFENSFPPAGWSIVNPNADVTWVRKTPGRASAFSAFKDNFSVNDAGRADDIRVPFININGADSLIITFDVAHKNYPGANDALLVGASFDCGNSYVAVYNKAGTTLATAGSSTAAYTTPIATDWRNERIALGGTIIAPGSVGLLIRNVSAYGNNVFVDNVNISALFKRDLQATSINGLSNLICNTASTTPSLTVRNVGKDTLTSFKVSYTINGGGLQTQTVTGISLPRNAQTTVTLPAINTSTPGVYVLRVFTSDPVSVTGTGDGATQNDTLVRTFSVSGTQSAPLTETFVNTAFPPANWGIANPDNGITWSRSTVGNGNAGSAYINTYNYNTLGAKDDLASPMLTFGTFDSARLSFDVAAVSYSYPGSTALTLDTLEVLLTRDCGNTFTSVYKKWGADLQTNGDPNTPQTGEFFPFGANQWRRETIDLSTRGLAVQSGMQFIFRVTNASENNIFIDNVNFATQTLPAQLKQQGYLVLPTSFSNSFSIWHYMTPTTLKYVHVVNAAGQIVWSKDFSGNAERQMTVDMSGKASGIYFVEVGYTDSNRNVTQRVFKQ